MPTNFSNKMHHNKIIPTYPNIITKPTEPKTSPTPTNHTDNEHIEEIKGPEWLTLALGTNRPQLLGVGAPETWDDTDKWFVLNALRVLMETNDSLRKRLSGIKVRFAAHQHHDKEVNAKLAELSRYSRGGVGTGLVMREALENLRYTWPEAIISDKGFFLLEEDEQTNPSLNELRDLLRQDGWELTDPVRALDGAIHGMLHRATGLTPT